MTDSQFRTVNLTAIPVKLLNAAPDSIELSQKKSFFGTVLSHLLLVNDFYFSWLNISKKNTNKDKTCPSALPDSAESPQLLNCLCKLAKVTKSVCLLTLINAAVAISGSRTLIPYFLSINTASGPFLVISCGPNETTGPLVAT